MTIADDLLPRALARHAVAEPDRPFATEVTGRTQTYAEADRAGDEFARAFAGLGISAGDRVLVFTPTCIDTLNIWTGIGRSGAVHVPINTNFDGQILKYVINTSKASVAICASRWVERITRLAAELTHLKTIVVIDEDEVDENGNGLELVSRPTLFQNSREDALLLQPELHDPAMMMFTSGTTGPSKAAILPWGAFAQASHNVAPPPGPDALTADDVFYLPFPLFHTSGTQWASAIARLGGHIVLRESFSTADFWSDVRKHGCTGTMLLGAMAGFLLKAASEESQDNPLRVVAVVPMIAGISELQERFRVSTYTLYGSTELGLVIGSGLNEILAPGSCGRLRPGYEARIVDQLDGEVADGEAGELVVRPIEPWTTFAEYFEMPKETVTAFRNLWFHTGDGFRREADGQLVFVDRIKDSIRRRGENISSAEIESFVIAHDAVLECAAVAVPAEFGEDEIKICVVRRPESDLTPAVITEFLVDCRVPRFMLPKYIEFLDELPKTPTSKIRKDILRSGGVTEATWTRPDDRVRR